MGWNRTLDSNDNIIIIGAKHPMRYAYSILVLCKKFDDVKVYIDKHKKFISKFGEKTVQDNWADVIKFLNEADIKIGRVNESYNEQYVEVTVEW